MLYAETPMHAFTQGYVALRRTCMINYLYHSPALLSSDYPSYSLSLHSNTHHTELLDCGYP